jgi:hypothetical protein
MIPTNCLKIRIPLMKKGRKQYIGPKVLQELPNTSMNCLKRETYPPNVNMPDSEGKKNRSKMPNKRERE